MLLQPGSTCWRVDTAWRAQILIDSAAYFAAAKSAMLQARRSIYLLGWAFDPLTQLIPDASGSGPLDDQAGPFLADLAKARPDLDVRILVWKSALPIAASQHFFPHRARRCFRGTPVRFRLDASVPLGACHHQKVLVIDDVVGFCGGGDMTTDRWDTPEHLDDDPQRRTPFGDIHAPRHEVMMCVEGPAAAALGELFRRRWLRATSEAVKPSGEAEAPTPWPLGLDAPFAGVRVGLARTEPAWRGQPEVRESEALHLLAFAAAKRLIYLENQYVAAPAIADALAARLAEPDGPEVVVISTEHSPSWFDRMTMDKTRSALLAQLQAADRYGRFHAYCPETRGGRTIIVHCKATVIDDHLLRVGSTNLNNRSSGFDSECDLAIEATDAPDDAPVRAAIAAHRTRSLAHFLGVYEAQMEATLQAADGKVGDAIAALDQGPQPRLRKLGPVRMGPLAQLIATFHLGDPAAPSDSWRPWRRRAAIRAGVEAATLLRQAAPERATDWPVLKSEDFIQGD